MTIELFIKKYGSDISNQIKRPFIEVKQELKNDLRAIVKQHNKDYKSYRCLIMHKWSKWEQFKVDIIGNYGEVKQRRICFRCDKVQEEFVEFAKEG